MGIEDSIVNIFQLLGNLIGVHDKVAEAVLQLILILSCRQRGFLIHHQFFFAVLIIFFPVDNRLFQIQGVFGQFEQIPVRNPVFRNAVHCGIVGCHIPFIFGFGVTDLTLDIKRFFQPVLNDFRRYPETPQFEIDFFNPQWFGLNGFQRRNVLRSKFTGNLQFFDDIAGEVSAFEFDFPGYWIFKEFSGSKQLHLCFFLLQFHHGCNVFNINFMPVSV